MSETLRKHEAYPRDFRNGGHSASKIVAAAECKAMRDIRPQRSRWQRGRVALKRIVGEYVLAPVFLVITIMIFAFVPVRYLRDGTFRSVSSDVDSFVKRIMDIFGALLGLVVGSICFLLIPVIIKLDSPGPVFYVQKRVGRDRRRADRRRSRVDVLFDRRNGDRRKTDYRGSLFEMYKFRTMQPDAEKQTGAVWARRNDPRITRCGRLLRLTRLDELPQLWNVLRGNMSLVGPRPERPEFVEKLSWKLPEYTKRLQIKPGLTGIAQVESGYDSSLDDVRKKLEFDLHYIQKRSLWLDIRIILSTFWVVLTGKGAV